MGFSHEGLPGMSSGVGEDVPCGIYLFDRRGGLELLIRKEGISCMYPILLAPRAWLRQHGRGPDSCRHLRPRQCFRPRIRCMFFPPTALRFGSVTAVSSPAHPRSFLL